MKSVCLMALICWVMAVINAFAAYHDAVKGQVTAKAGATSPPKQTQDLVLLLTTDRKIYHVGEEMHIGLEWVHRGKKPFRILSDDTFVGRHMECRDLDGKACQTQEGYNSWSPKAGVFTGRTVLLRPVQSIRVKMDARVDEHRKLIFSNLFERAGSSGFREFKKKLNLPDGFPDKYIAAGKIIQGPPFLLFVLLIFSAAMNGSTAFILPALKPGPCGIDIGKTLCR